MSTVIASPPSAAAIVTASRGKSTLARKGAPDRDRHVLQWQAEVPAGDPVTVTLIAPQKQRASVAVAAVEVAAVAGTDMRTVGRSAAATTGKSRVLRVSMQIYSPLCIL